MIGRRNIDRVISVGFIGALVWLTLLIRLFTVQVVLADDYHEKAKSQQQKKITLRAPRGGIFDLNGRQLAKSTTALTFWTERHDLLDIETVDSAFCSALGYESGFIKEKIKKSRNNWLYLARNIELSKGLPLKKLESNGVYSYEVYDRSYPYGETAAHLLGFADIDGKGCEGLELYYNKQLKGDDGHMVVLTDAGGHDYRLFRFGGKPAFPGMNLHLTIDTEFQQIVESELAFGVEKFRAESGMAVFIRPATGEILAIACYPSFDPNEPGESEPLIRKIRAITDIYEPGSTFKIVAFSALLENGLFDPEEIVDCENGEWFFCDDTIHDAEAYGKTTARNVLIHSSNIGTIKLSLKLTKEELYNYARAFGFGSPTGIDLIGEVDGILHKPQRWSGMTPAAFAMGHEVAVTTIQMATAYATIANRGILVQPRLVDKITNDHEEILREIEPTIIRRSIKAETADSLALLMKAVVDSGTGVRARIEGLTVAGKTGTAQKTKPGGRGYYDDRFVSSFAGFTPVENPGIVGVIVIDNPRRSPHWGGWTAAPVWKSIVEKAYTAGVINFKNNEKIEWKEPGIDYVAVPDIRRMTESQANEVLGHRGLASSSVGEGIVLSQSPGPGRMVPPGTVVRLALRKSEKTWETDVEVPGVIGMPLRDAAMEFAEVNVSFKVVGSGVVTKQDPPPGSLIDRNQVCLLTCNTKE